MKKVFSVLMPVLLTVGFFALPVVGADTLLRFKGGIGVILVRGNASFTANVILGVIPAGQPWVIRDLEARVMTNGEIKVKGEGLIRTGGNIGTTSDDPLMATLFCGNVAHDSGAVLPEAFLWAQRSGTGHASRRQGGDPRRQCCEAARN